MSELNNKRNQIDCEDDDDDEEEDADYVPSEHELSEEESGSEMEGDIAGSSASSSLKCDSRLSITKSRQSNSKEKSPSEDKARADALWADFMADVGPKNKSKTQSKETKSSQSQVSKTNTNLKKITPATQENNEAHKTTTIKFGSLQTEKVINSESVETHSSPNIASAPPDGKRKAGGLNAVLGFINKKQKISTLDKSKLDWEKYKRESGLTDELHAHKNSNRSYLERKEFLERTDQRQFELERNARLSSRSNTKR